MAKRGMRAEGKGMDQPVSVPGSCTNLTTLVPCD